MSHILVTGAGGFLGYHVTKSLLEKGKKVVGVDNLIGGDLNLNVAPLLRKYQDQYSFFKLDASTWKLDRFIGDMDINTVFHAACYPHEGLSVSSPYQIAGYSVGLLSMNILRFAVKNKVRRLINCSSMARYGFQEVVPFTEDMTPNPVDPYGIFKLASEKAMAQVCSTNGIEFVNLVPHNIYGPNQKYDDPFRNVAAIMINRVLQNKQPVIYGDGKQKRCFSYVGDVVDPIINSFYQAKVNNETINIGPEAPFIEINELAKIICKMGSLKFNPIYVPSRPLEVREANCSNKKSKELLDAKYETDIETGLKEMFNFIKSNGPKPFNYHLNLEIMNEKTPVTWIDRGMNEIKN